MAEEFSIAKLDAKPGDTVVVRFNNRTVPGDIIDRVRASVEPNIPDGVKVLVIGNDVDISVISASPE